MDIKKYNKPYNSSVQKIIKSVSPGDILIAKPFMNCYEYMRSVVLIIGNDDTGTMGLILNKPSTFMVTDVMDDIAADNRLLFGGSDELDAISYIHNVPGIPDSIKIGEEVYYGGDWDIIETMLHLGSIKHNQIHFFAGSVLWERNALMVELGEDKWWVDKISHNEIFKNPMMEDLWGVKLLAKDNMYGIFSEFPDPSIN